MQQTGTEYNGSERCNGNKKYGIQYIGLLFMLLMLNKTGMLFQTKSVKHQWDSHISLEIGTG